MDNSFEVQYLSSLSNVSRRRSSAGGVVTALNLFILILGFTCVAIGYVLNNTSREQIEELLGGDRSAIERPLPSVKKSVSAVSKTLLGLLG
jgi:hypothetical protein